MSLSPEIVLQHEVHSLFEAALQLLHGYPELGHDASLEVIADANARMDQAAANLNEAEGKILEIRAMEALSVMSAWNGGRAENVLALLRDSLALLCAEADFYSPEHEGAA